MSEQQRRMMVLSGMLVAALMVRPAVGQLIPDFLGWGQCSNTPPQQNFDVSKFAGTWFTLERVPNQYVKTAACVYANYTASGNNLEVQEFGMDEAGKQIEVSSLMRSNGADKPFTVIAEGVPEAPLKVIATDYEDYACLQSCMQFLAFNAEFAWILTKRPASGASAIKKCREVMKTKLEFDNTQFKKVRQGTGCVYPR